MLKKKMSKVQVNPVPTEDSKITFKITLFGELDWNRDFVRKSPEGYSMIDEHAFHHGTNLKQSIFDFVWRAIENSVGDPLTGAQLISAEISQAVIDQFNNVKSISENEKRAKLAAELAEAERKAASLRAQLNG